MGNRVWVHENPEAPPLPLPPIRPPPTSPRPNVSSSAMQPLPPHITTPSQPHAAPYPAVAPIVDRLRQIFGEPGSVGPTMLRWWVEGDGSPAKETGVAILMDTTPPREDAPSVIWVTRPGEVQPERCPIVSMPHLESFLALVSIARHSAAPVHGHVCPGED